MTIRQPIQIENKKSICLFSRFNAFSQSSSINTNS